VVKGFISVKLQKYHIYGENTRIRGGQILRPAKKKEKKKAWEPPGSGFLTQAVGGDGPKVEGVRASRGAGSPQRGIVGQPRRLVRAARGAEQLLAARPRQVNINR
jgi:hypothetical protein